MKGYLTAILLGALLTLSSAQQRSHENQIPSSIYSHEHNNIQSHGAELHPPTTQDVTIGYISRLNPFLPQQQRRPHSWTVKMHPSPRTPGDYSGFTFLEHSTPFRRAWIANGPEGVECYIGGLRVPDGSNVFSAEKPFRGNARSRMLKCELKGKGLRRVEEVRDGDDDNGWLLRGGGDGGGVGNGNNERLLKPYEERRLLNGASRGELPPVPEQRGRRKSSWW